MPCGTNADPVADVATAVIPTPASASAKARSAPSEGKDDTSPAKNRGWSWLDVTAETSLQCPMTDLSLPAVDAIVKNGDCPFHKHGQHLRVALTAILAAIPEEEEQQQQPASVYSNIVDTTAAPTTTSEDGSSSIQCPLRRVQLQLKDGSPYATEQTMRLLREIGGGDVVRLYCTRFYTRVFFDKQLDPFFFSGDGAVGHANRLGNCNY